MLNFILCTLLSQYLTHNVSRTKSEPPKRVAVTSRDLHRIHKILRARKTAFIEFILHFARICFVFTGVTNFK